MAAGRWPNTSTRLQACSMGGQTRHPSHKIFEPVAWSKLLVWPKVMVPLTVIVPVLQDHCYHTHLATRMARVTASPFKLLFPSFRAHIGRSWESVSSKTWSKASLDTGRTHRKASSWTFKVQAMPAMRKSNDLQELLKLPKGNGSNQPASARLLPVLAGACVPELVVL